MRKKIEDAVLSDRIRVGFAATSDWNVGKPPHGGTRKKLDEINTAFENMHARQVVQEDFTKYVR